MTSAEIDNEELFQALRVRPFIAWPTVIVLFACLITLATSWYLVLTGTIALWLGSVLNCVAAYFLFSPAHDGLHRAISNNDKLNDFFANLAVAPIFFMPMSFKLFRMYHMQHHIKCGDPELDPDLKLSSKGSNAFSLWFIWGSQYIGYGRKYKRELPRLNIKYPRLQLFVSLAILVVLFINLPLEMLFLWLVPTLFVLWMTAFVFSYLPHHIHPHVEGEDEMSAYQTTCNRVGAEWLLSPLCQYQNYHLVHHLYPTVPFYRYIKVWNARKTIHEQNRPAEVYAFSNRPTHYT